jgi:CDP-glycerol glycerophosphotransferase
MYDLDEYKGKLRDFYLDLDELPGPIVEVQDDLEKEISKISNYYKRYKSKYDKFNKKYNYLDGNDCSKKVLEVVIDE